MPETKQVTVIIADDEELARERIRQILKEDLEIQILAECSNGRDAVAAVSRFQPDLLFLDIQMPGMDGFGVIRKVALSKMPLIIFVTAYDQYAVQAFEFHACDYLLKPFKKKRFHETLARAKDQLKHRYCSDYDQRITKLLEGWKQQPYLERISIKDRDRVFFVKTSEVDWFQAEDNYVRIHTGSSSHLIRQTMRAIEKDLDPRRFVRIHRTAIVNVEKIHELQQFFHRDYRVVLQNGTKIPLSRSYKEKLRAVLGLTL